MGIDYQVRQRREGGREGKRKGGKEGGKEGGREEGRETGRERWTDSRKKEVRANTFNIIYLEILPLKER